MPIGKKAASKFKGVPFHRDFNEPTTEARNEALGSFPCQTRASNSREQMLNKSAKKGQPSLQALAAAAEESSSDGVAVSSTTMAMALSDLDEKRLFIPTPRSETSLATPQPIDELDWLAQIPEEGQTFDDYLRLLTTRTTGRINSLANAGGVDILLLPIIHSEHYPRSGKQGDDNDDANSLDATQNAYSQWPEYGPSLEKLVEYTKVFFDRQVHILPAAQLYVSNPPKSNGGTKKKRKVASSQPGAFAAASKCKFKLFLPQDDGRLSTPVNIAGRADISTGRIQLQVTSLLDELSRYRYSRHGSNEKDFCIMGITMEDLFDGPSDLFCAGMAFGGDKVAVFSFKRYHPLIKMHPLYWHQFGYAETSDGYSYYDDDDQDPKGLSTHPAVISQKSQMESEFLRRSCKLLTHELGHLYGIDHCIHNRCLMMGTGHLVEDFRAPTHLCGVCLRKLQWRTGFNVRMRYKLLTEVFTDMGLEKESKWTQKQYDRLNVLE